MPRSANERGGFVETKKVDPGEIKQDPWSLLVEIKLININVSPEEVCPEETTSHRDD